MKRENIQTLIETSWSALAGLLARSAGCQRKFVLLSEAAVAGKARTPPAVPPQGAPAADPKLVRPELRPAPGFTRGDSPAKRKYSEEKTAKPGARAIVPLLF